MSIEFMLDVYCKKDYEEDDGSTYSSVLVHSTLDLGNFRALRNIFSPIDKEWGEKKIIGYAVLDWLNRNIDKSGLQVEAAHDYLACLLDKKGGDVYIECVVSWS